MVSKGTALATAMLVLCGVRGSGAEDQQWNMRLEGFLKNGTKPFTVYALERDGQWVTGVVSSRDPERAGNKRLYNLSWHYADLSKAPIRDGRARGPVTLHITPDAYIPHSHLGFTIDLEIDARVEGDRMQGAYKVLGYSCDPQEAAGFSSAGKVSGTRKPKAQGALPNPVTFRCNLQGAMIGGDPAFGERAIVVLIGMQDGKLGLLAYGRLDSKGQMQRLTNLEIESVAVTSDQDSVTAHVEIPLSTLDMRPCRYTFDISGHRLGDLLVGAYALTATPEGAPAVTLQGAFDGTVEKGIPRIASDDRPWFVERQDFTPAPAGEHPRVLFRRQDLPALRKRAETPEGQAILKRLRRLLDGKNGDTMTTAFSAATKAYMPKSFANPALDQPGVYTFSHGVGYGLLYQLTGDKKYAEFGRQCFEKAFAGVRDRDDRYAWVNPGGGLRAGPILGWYAVGYDLCYDGWDEATREKITRAIADYTGGDASEKKFTLELLARSDYPPKSNHFGLQVGGASLALMAIMGEKWVDQSRMDALLRVARNSIVRNAEQGFGDGGCFAEGDGTGSMSSFISYLSAVQAWRTAMGVEFCDIERPNVRMMVLKWIYGTVVRSGNPDFWPIRGSYGHNVWARGDKSGAGYFAIGMGAVAEKYKAAMKWYYDEFLLASDAKRGVPYDTVSEYPHLAVSAFVHWPLALDPVNPATVLPLCHRDTSCDFFRWRNRWQDENDTVISVQLGRTEGYMVSKQDGALMLNTMGRHERWGQVGGRVKHWWASEHGEASSLTLTDGTCLAIDLTGAAGVDVLLVITGKAKGQSVTLGKKDLTLYAPTCDAKLAPRIERDRVLIGKQSIRLEDGNLVLGVTTREAVRSSEVGNERQSPAGYL